MSKEKAIILGTLSRLQWRWLWREAIVLHEQRQTTVRSHGKDIIQRYRKVGGLTSRSKRSRASASHGPGIFSGTAKKKPKSTSSTAWTLLTSLFRLHFPLYFVFVTNPFLNHFSSSSVHLPHIPRCCPLASPVMYEVFQSPLKTSY